jgi:hypothetical protein
MKIYNDSSIYEKIAFLGLIPFFIGLIIFAGLVGLWAGGVITINKFHYQLTNQRL